MSNVGFKIGDKHTFRDWGLRCYDYKITFPERQKNLLQVPGRNGKIDVSLPQQREAYGHRTIEIYCDAPDRNYEEWTKLCSDIANYVQDEFMPVTADFDSGYYYRGWVTMNPSKEWKEGSDIVFTVDAEPYKCKQKITTVKVVGNTSGVRTILSNEKRKVNPKITTDAAVSIFVSGNTHNFNQSGTYERAGFELPAGDTPIIVTGKANVIIEYQEAKL